MGGLNKYRWALPKKAAKYFVMGYAPEMDKSSVLEPDMASYCQYLIGMVRWMVEIGRVDIITEVSLLASQLEMTR